jgi:hypothetical protein
MLDPDVRRLVVFSHPNHELSVYGLLKRLRPDVVYLTDGGGEDRLSETRAGLSRIGLLDRARFLNHSEASFYDALLDRDVAFYRRVADEVRRVVDEVRPEQVLCDAVELYNPVHDMTLPIVDAALAGCDAEVLEVPLVWQRAGDGESYVIQRVPPARRATRLEARLTDDELDAKVHAREHVYTLLRGQMGPPLTGLPPSYLAQEEVMPRDGAFPTPGADVALRYEWRAHRLRERGEVDRVITLRDHYVPVTSALRANA